MRGGRPAAARRRVLKVFLLTLALLLPDGSTIDVPIEIWKFQSRSDCTLSADYLNKGKVRARHAYRCVETDAVRLAELRANSE